MTDRKQWLLERKSYLGGSEIAAIAGLNPYRSAVDVYLDKINDTVADDITSDAAHFGTLLEDIVAQEYSRRTGNKVSSDNQFIRHPEYPFLAVNIDRWVNDGEFILECKTSSLMLKDKWGIEGTDEIPEHYLTQCAFGAEICNVPKVDIPVLIGGQIFKIYEYREDKLLQKSLIELAKNFWLNHVAKRIPPEAKSLQDINKLYPEPTDNSINANEEIKGLLRTLSILKVEGILLEERVKQVQLQIQNYMGNNSLLIDENNNVLATWKSSKPRSTLDSKSLQKDMPDIYQKYLNEGKSYRTFLIKDKSGKNE